MQIFDITVPANMPQVVHAAGRYIKYVSGSNGGGDATVVLTPGMQGGTKITLQPGQAYRVSDAMNVPDSWTIANYAGGAAIVGKVIIGDGRIDDSTVSGTVQVVDGGKVRSLNGSAYAGAVGTNPGAGIYGQTQIYNPVGSGVRLVVEAVQLSGTNAALSCNLTGNGVTLGSTTTKGSPKLIGAANGAAILQHAELIGGPYNLATWQLSVQAGGSAIWTPKEPIVILPSYGLMLWANSPNVNFAAAFEWFEEPNV